MGKIATFYSYKGGTGRSMALANVAWVLASFGQKVLVIDWDLEAPGLHRYFRPFLPDKDLTRLESQGVIDLVGDFAERLAAQPAGDRPPPADWYKPYADISKWTQRLLWPTGHDARTNAGGFIDFVPAGRQGPQYAKKVNSFDWAQFYERYNLGGFLDAVRDSMARYDWVLIDSRTGVSDTSGICTVHFPDILVVCFTLNYQSIDGACAVAASAKTARQNRPLRVLPVPMRLDGNEEKLLNAMLAYARSVFTPLLDPDIDVDRYWRETGIPYFSRYAYSEKLAPFEDQVNVSTSTLPSIERLVSDLTSRTITRLEPLPEAERKMALAEFEQLPEEVVEPVNVSARRGGFALWRAPRELWYRYMARPWGEKVMALSPIILLAVGGVYLWQRESPETFDVVPALIDDARKDLAANRREHAALLIAEAASRLGPNAVVSADIEPGKQVYDAFQSLRPLVLSAADAGASPADVGALAPWIVVFSPYGDRAASTARQRITWVSRFPPPMQGTGVAVGYSTVAFDADQRYVAASGRNGSVTVWDDSGSKRVWQWENPDPDSAWVTAVTFSPNGQLLAFGTDTGDVYLFQAAAWKQLGRFTHGGEIQSLAFSPDSRYVASGGSNGWVFFWSPAQPDKPVERFGLHTGPLKTIAFAPSTRPIRVATSGGDGLVRVWTQTANLPEVATIQVGRNVYAVAFSPDGATLAIGDTDVVRLVQVVDGKPGQSRTLNAPGVGALAFSTDGKLLATGGTDNTARIWDVSTLSERERVTLSTPVTAVAISVDGKYLGVGSREGTSWAPLKDRNQAFSSTDIQAFACSQVRDLLLSPEEWKRYFGDEPLRYTCGPRSTAGATPAAK